MVIVIVIPIIKVVLEMSTANAMTCAPIIVIATVTVGPLRHPVKKRPSQPMEWTKILAVWTCLFSKP